MLTKTSDEQSSDIRLCKTEKGVWLLIDAYEYFLPYKQFPWFKDARESDINTVNRPTNRHLYWPVLDLSLDLRSLDSLEKYPLLY